MTIQTTLSAADCERIGLPVTFADRPIVLSAAVTNDSKKREYQRSYRGVICKYFADKLGISKDEAHQEIMKTLYPVITWDVDELTVLPGSTENFTHTDYKHLMDGAEKLAFKLFNEMPPRDSISIHE